MTAHAYGMVGRAADALSVLDRLDRELERRGSDSRYGGMPDAYRSWVLRNLGVRRAVDLARSTAERAPMLEIHAQSRLDLVDSLLMAGQVDAAVEAFEATTPFLADPALSNRWRCEQRSGILAARLHLLAGDAGDALTRAGEVADVAAGRGDVRYATIARLVHARAQARLGRRGRRAAGPRGPRSAARGGGDRGVVVGGRRGRGHRPGARADGGEVGGGPAARARRGASCGLRAGCGTRAQLTVATSSSTTGRNGSCVAATAATASRTSALRSSSDSPATNPREWAIASRYRTTSSGVSSPTSTAADRTLPSSPASRALASKSSVVPTASERSRTAVYHSGGDQPKVREALVDRLLQGGTLVAEHRGEEHAAGSGHATQLAQGRDVVGHVVEHEPRHHHVEVARPEGEPGDVADDRVSPRPEPMPEHVRLQVHRHHLGAELPQQIAGGARAGSRVQRTRARKPALEPGHQVPGERDVGQRRVVGPRAGRAPVGATHRVRSSLQPPGTGQGGRGPPGQLVLVADGLLPGERRHDADQAQSELPVPPVAGLDPAPLQRRAGTARWWPPSPPGVGCG